MPRLRVVAYQVQVVAFADDGSTLEPLEIPSVTIKASDIAGLDWDNALSHVREQVEGLAPAPPAASVTSAPPQRTPAPAPTADS